MTPAPIAAVNCVDRDLWSSAHRIESDAPIMSHRVGQY